MGEENSEEKVWLRRENGKEKKDIMWSTIFLCGRVEMKVYRNFYWNYIV